MDFFENFIQQAPSTALFAIIGGILLKVIEKRISSPSDNANINFALRKELREELDAVLERVDKLQEEVNAWRDKYYEQVQLDADLRLEIATLKEQLLTKHDAANFDDMMVMQFARVDTPTEPTNE